MSTSREVAALRLVRHDDRLHLRVADISIGTASMSVTVKLLNADTTFLLTFSPVSSTSLSNADGAFRPFTILIDPWLSGPAIIGASWFASSEHTTPPCLRDLSEIDEPDLVIVSQNKTDHCHEVTLRQLPPNTKTRIVAEPGAAKAIRAYNHFEPSRIIKMRKYCQNDPTSILRFPVDPLSPSGRGGEVTIAFVPAKNYYLNGLHNAIGITYQAPTGLTHYGSGYNPSLTLPAKAVLRERAPNETSLPSMPENSLATNPLAAISRLIRSDVVGLPATNSWASASGLHYESQSPKASSDVPATCPGSPMSTSTFDSVFDPSFRVNVVSPATTIPPLSPPHATHIGQVLPISPSSTNCPVNPGPLSIIYSPHGVPLQKELQSYVTTYLRPLSSIPLTLLLHSFDRVDNPWYFGGNICTGARGGMELAHAMRARCWVSAHDEDKDDRGLATKLVRKERLDVREIMQALATRESDGGGRWQVSVRRLGVGEQLILSPSDVDYMPYR